MTKINMNLEKQTGISEQELGAFEREHGIKLPHQYRQFLLDYNGGRPEHRDFNFKDSTNGSQLLGFFGVGSRMDLSKELRTYKGRLPAGWFPVASDAGGNLICICLSGTNIGKVFFWDHEMESDETQGLTPETAGNTVLIADSFDEFLNSFYTAEED